jgi:hypothetical protein
LNPQAPKSVIASRVSKYSKAVKLQNSQRLNNDANSLNFIANVGRRAGVLLLQMKIFASNKHIYEKAIYHFNFHGFADHEQQHRFGTRGMATYVYRQLRQYRKF